MQRHHPAEEPYVVSNDLMTALGPWLAEKKLAAPCSELVKDIRRIMHDSLSGIFSEVQVLSETALKQGVGVLISERKLPIVSLDPLIAIPHSTISISRAVDVLRKDAGIVNRYGSEEIQEQIKKVADGIQGDVALVDDVIFSGKTISDYIIPLLRKNGVVVREVISAVGIQSGVKLLQSRGVIVSCVKMFESVKDEVCERDFFPGIPFSGRAVISEINCGMPYVEPFGDMENWASIPRNHVRDFSKVCIEQTARLFENIEERSGCTIRCADLPRKVFGLNYTNPSEPYAAALKKYVAIGAL